MSTSLSKNCPHCKKDFQARRKNQRYCSTECKTDANNVVNKARYALFKEEAPHNKRLKESLRKWKVFYDSLTILIWDVIKLDHETIAFNGYKYKFNAKAYPPPLPVSLKQGGGIVMKGGRIIYLMEGPAPSSLDTSNIRIMYSEYVLIDK